MKKLLIAICMVAGMTTTAMAQRGQGMRATPEQRAQRQTERLTEALKLTPDQQKQVYDANLKAAQQMKPMQDATDADRSAFREAQQQKEASFKTILTPDQFQQYLKLKEEMRNKMRERSGNNDPSTGN